MAGTIKLFTGGNVKRKGKLMKVPRLLASVYFIDRADRMATIETWRRVYGMSIEGMFLQIAPDVDTRKFNGDKNRFKNKV